MATRSQAGQHLDEIHGYALGNIYYRLTSIIAFEIIALHAIQ